MTDDQFSALAKLLQLRNGPAQDAARAVLVLGLTPTAAAWATGASRQSVSNTLNRCRAGLMLVKKIAE